MSKSTDIDTVKRPLDSVVAIPEGLTVRQKAMLKALEASLGIVAPACRQAGIHRTTHYLWMNENPAYAEAVAAMDDIRLDFAEHRLVKNIEAGKEASLLFFLKCKGKGRGYVERIEQERAIEISPPSVKMIERKVLD